MFSSCDGSDDDVAGEVFNEDCSDFEIELMWRKSRDIKGVQNLSRVVRNFFWVL